MQQEFPLDLTFRPKDTMIASPSSCSYIPDTKPLLCPEKLVRSRCSTPGMAVRSLHIISPEHQLLRTLLCALGKNSW